jgi:AcrR family transcriptional regulator
MDRLMSDARSVRARLRLEEVDEAARRVIARKGLASATMRDISREGGFTTGLLTHYFPDKEALIVGVFSSASDEWIERVRSAMSEAKNAQERLGVAVTLGIPGDPEDRRNWRLWSEMWSYACGNPTFAEHVIATDALWEQELEGVLKAAIAEELLPKKLDVRAQARVLARLVDGLGVRSVLSQQWDDSRELLIAHLAAIGLVPKAVRALKRLVANQ